MTTELHPVTAANRDHFNEYVSENPFFGRVADAITKSLTDNYSFDEGKTSVLDFACGTGMISRRLAPHAKKITGVDISDKTVEYYNEKAAAQSTLSEKLKAISMNLTGKEDELGGEKFDVIVCSQAYHHVPSIEEMTKNLVVHLKPTGVLMVVDLVRDAPLSEEAIAASIHPESGELDDFHAHKPGSHHQPGNPHYHQHLPRQPAPHSHDESSSTEQPPQQQAQKPTEECPADASAPGLAPAVDSDTCAAPAPAAGGDHHHDHQGHEHDHGHSHNHGHGHNHGGNGGDDNKKFEHVVPHRGGFIRSEIEEAFAGAGLLGFEWHRVAEVTGIPGMGKTVQYFMAKASPSSSAA